MTGRRSQHKGAAGERELAGLLQQAGYQVRRGGSETFGTVPDLVGLPGIHVEVKRVERLNLSEAMSQAVRDAARFNDGFPAVFHRRNREPWRVTMNYSDWLQLYTIWIKSQNPEILGSNLKKPSNLVGYTTSCAK